MASYAELKANLETPFGHSHRLGDVIAGELHIRDRDRGLFSPSNSSVSAKTYSLDGDLGWNEQGLPVDISTTSTDGIREWSFEPDEDDLWRVVFTLDGDYKAKTEITVRVHDSTDDWDNHRSGDNYS